MKRTTDALVHLYNYHPLPFALDMGTHRILNSASERQERQLPTNHGCRKESVSYITLPTFFRGAGPHGALF
jgi:hypothetical protein